MRKTIGMLAGAAALWASPMNAKVIDQSDMGFTVAHTAHVAATPQDVWKMLRMPQKWWSKQHSWTGDAENFWLDLQAGGCFCEKIPGEGDRFGSVQHARVIFAKPYEMLRLDGAFGPLQGEALTGTLTIFVKETPTGAAIRFDYVVGGYARFKLAEVAPAVDAVIGEQIAGLARALGGALPPARGEVADEPEPEPEKAAPAEKRESDLGDAVADLVNDEPQDEAVPD